MKGNKKLPPSIVQLPLFNLDQLEVTIKDYDHYFQAELFEGWYIARGKTKEEAIKRVIAQIERFTS